MSGSVNRLAPDMQANPLIPEGSGVNMGDAWNTTAPVVRNRLATAWQAAQDPQTWQDAAQLYGQALLAGTSSPGMKMTPTAMSNRIGRYAEIMGYRVAPESSRISKSEYLNLTHDALPDGLKVRVSDHDLPPSYGSPGDYDIRPSDGSFWQDVVKSLADRVGAPVPKPSDLAKQTAAKKMDQLGTFSGQLDLLMKTYPGELKDAGLSGLAARYEAANPGKIQWMPAFTTK